MYDRPETSNVFAAAMYIYLCYVSLPFIMLLGAINGGDRLDLLSWIELAVHIISFIAAISIFSSYLKDSFWNVQTQVKNIALTAALAVVLIGVVVYVMAFLEYFTELELIWAGLYGSLPLVDNEVFVSAAYLVELQPLWGTLVTVFLVPFATCCMFYGVGFAPAASNKPWLGYVVVCIVLLIPRLCNGLTHWVLSEQLAFYFARLPMHLICCWSYQKTDTIWTPIFVHMAVNLISCGLCLYLT